LFELRGLKILYKQNCSDLRKISEVSPPRDKLLKEYLECVILKHLSIVEEFINELDSYKGREEFITKALKYHFTCIIDSYTDVPVAYQH